MKETSIHKDYQITIPREIVDTLNIKLEDKLIWEIKGNEICIKIKKQQKLNDKSLYFVEDEEIDSINFNEKKELIK